MVSILQRAFPREHLPMSIPPQASSGEPRATLHWPQGSSFPFPGKRRWATALWSQGLLGNQPR